MEIDIYLRGYIILKLNDILVNLDSLNINFNNYSKIKRKLIIKFINDLKTLLFSKTLKRSINIKTLYNNLNKILKSVEVKNNKEISNKFFYELLNIKELLFKDLTEFLKKDPACNNIDEVVLSYNSFHAIYVYRVANLLYRLNVPVIPRYLTEYGHSITGIDIHPGATIKEYFFIDHGTGIVIGETVLINNHVSIYQGVTLGAKSLKEGFALKGVKRHPTICDNVVIYANATILGGDTLIKENSVIPGNAFITTSN